MLLQIQLVKPLGDIIGADKTVEINIDNGVTVKNLIDKIVELYGEKASEIILDPKKEKIKIVVIVDGKNGDLKTKLNERSKVVLLIPYGGG